MKRMKCRKRGGGEGGDCKCREYRGKKEDEDLKLRKEERKQKDEERRWEWNRKVGKVKLFRCISS
jgi:hypothetical protein